MAKRVILAVAGAGKTYHICNAIDTTKRNLILAFTHENIHNIQRELCAAYGCVPEMTTVSTFDAFVYREMVLPYEPSIAEYFGNTGFVSRGICMKDPPPMCIKGRNGAVVYNTFYHKKNEFNHYITKRGQYYCATLPELVLQVKRGKESLATRIAQRLNKFYDAVLIDEFQDFREYDYDLIMTLAKQLKDVTLVGDYYQHSVSATNNSGKPFKKRNKNVGYVEFIEELKKAHFEIDTTTLEKSRRCSAEVCDYVRGKLGINIVSNGDHQGSVIWIQDQAEVVLSDDNILKLVYSESSTYSFKAMNWSYSKGDTVNAACVILTEKFEYLDSDNFTTKGIDLSTINKLYIAMTRSCANLYLMKSSTFKGIKKRYLKGIMPKE